MPHEEYEGNFYNDAEHLWDNLGFDDYEFTAPELEQAYTYFLDFLQDADLGYSPESSMAFWDFIDYMGLDYEDFKGEFWDEFREWYSAQ